MEININQENWNELIIRLKKKYPRLTEADFRYKVGHEDSMLRMIEYKLRKTKKEMQNIIAGL